MEKSPDVFLRKICSLDQSTKIMISNNKLNTFLEKTNNSHRAPQKGNFRPKIKFLKQVNSRPIILKAFGTRLKGVNKDYKNYFLKQFLRLLELISFSSYAYFYSSFFSCYFLFFCLP